MNKEKQDYIQNQNKFHHIMFVHDYLTNIFELAGTLNSDDFIAGLVRLYDSAYLEGRQDTLDKYQYAMFQDLDEIEKIKGES